MEEESVIGVAMLMVKARKKRQNVVSVILKPEEVGSFLHMLEWWTDRYGFIEETGDRCKRGEEAVQMFLTSPGIPSHLDGKVVDVVYTNDKVDEFVLKGKRP